MSHDENHPGQPLQVAGKPLARQGIMVFSSSSNMLYANNDAHYFLKRLSQQGYAMGGAIPVIITDQFDKMKKVLETQSVDSDRNRLEASRVILGQDQPVLLQIFGLSDRLGVQGSRVVIKMEDMAPVLGAAPPGAVPPPFIVPL